MVTAESRPLEPGRSPIPYRRREGLRRASVVRVHSFRRAFEVTPMNAVTQDIFHQADELSADVRQPFPACRQIYVGGGNGIRVPIREISLSATKPGNGIEPKPAVTVSATSGPLSD